LADARSELLAEVAFIGRLYGTLLSSSPDEPLCAKMIEFLGDGGEAPTGGFPGPPRNLRQEYQRLFIGPERLHAPPWGSVYLDKDQVVFGSSTIELRAWLRQHGIAVHDGKKEPEDQIGKMLLLMAWLAEEQSELLGEFLSEHLMPWAPRYLDLLAEDARLPLYYQSAQQLRQFLGETMADLGIKPTKKRLYR